MNKEKKSIKYIFMMFVVSMSMIFLAKIAAAKSLKWQWLFREKSHSVMITIPRATYESFVTKPRCSYICEEQSAVQKEPVILSIADQLKKEALKNGYDTQKVLAEFIASFGQSIAQQTYYNYLNKHRNWYPLYATQLIGRLLFAQNKTGLCADFSILSAALLYLNGFHKSGLVEIDSKDHAAVVVYLPGVTCHGAVVQNKIWCFFDSTGMDNFDLYNGAPVGTPVKVYVPFKEDVNSQ